MIKMWSEDGWGITLKIGSGCAPVFQQIVDQISFHITSGNLKIGDKLPPVRYLAEKLEINFNTVAKAYHDLSRLGIIDGRKGGGSTVARRSPLPENSRREKLEELYEKLMAEAASYGFAKDEIIEFILKKEKE